MLQIRLSVPDFSNGVAFTDPIIMENADNITLPKSVSSSDEGITFEIPLTDPKLQYINKFRWWECWDTATNQRLNYGPIDTITRGSGETKKISGSGRSALLLDYYKSVQTYYYPVDRFLDDLRFENLCSEPRTSTIINLNTSSDYYGLSKRTKDRAIDEQTGYIAIGRDVPTKSQKKTDSIWAGTGKSDWLVVDMGDTYTITKAQVLLPWWGGATINNNRFYDWDVSISTDNALYEDQYEESWPENEPHGMSPEYGGRYLYWGGSGFEQHQQIIDADNPVDFRYFKINISDVHARYGQTTATEIINIVDAWDWECGGSNVLFGDSVDSPSVSTGDLIDKTTIVPSSDCYAAVVEIGLFKKILDRDQVTNLVYHQIDDASRQITFYHVPDATETFTAGSGKKFEPGGTFRTLHITTSSDVTAKDEYNVPVYVGGSGTIRCQAYTKFLLFTGSGDVQVTYADTWPAVLEAYSYGGRYTYTQIQGDYLILDFRGVSLKWFATIPSNKTPGTVSIELREKDSLGVWGAWQTIEASFTLPANVQGEKIYEITYESGLLQVDIPYQLKITNLDGNFVSLDSFAGYWTGTYNEYNEDHNRITIRHLDHVQQLYDQRYGEGSIYKYHLDTSHLSLIGGFTFKGDRLVIFSRKGPDYGKLKFYIFDSINAVRLPIPGGDADGGYQVNLDYPYDIPQAVVFDSNEIFDAPFDGMPWSQYALSIEKVGGTGDVWIDGIGVHEATGLSVKFLNNNYQDILKSVTEAIQMEWDITEDGLLVVPRLGTDTDVIFAEGRGTTIKIEDVQDVTKIATQLVSSGADIDGLPLSAIVEDRKTRRTFGRTIQRLYDVRNIGDYFTLIGASRTELLRRRDTEKRITIQTTDLQGIQNGDSFIVKHPDLETRARATTITRSQSSSGGTNYQLECIQWPQII